jgi:hypothetical protein
MKEPTVQINALMVAISPPAAYQFSHLIVYLLVARSQRFKQTKSQRSQPVYLLNVTEAKGPTGRRLSPCCVPVLLFNNLIKIRKYANITCANK